MGNETRQSGPLYQLDYLQGYVEKIDTQPESQREELAREVLSDVADNLKAALIPGWEPSYAALIALVKKLDQTRDQAIEGILSAPI
jgi:hypothetical protein